MFEVINQYKALSYSEKLDALLRHFGNSSRFSEEVGVSRTSVVRWQDNPEAIRPAHKLDIDVLYGDVFVTPELDKLKPASIQAQHLPDDVKLQQAITHVRQFSYGTYEIEAPNSTREDFERILDQAKLPKGITTEAYHGMFNSWFVTRDIWQQIVDRDEAITWSADKVRQLHRDLMRGVRDDAGDYAQKFRVMGKLEDVRTTDPDDIPAEVAYWCEKYAHIDDLIGMAKAHAHFMAIHPFGDGNGRVGRALMLAQALQARLMPPILGKHNQALYYSTMAYAMRHGRHTPLAALLNNAQQGEP